MTDLIDVERAGQILTIGLNRPDKKNALNTEMFRTLSSAYTELCDDPELRCGVLYSKAELFTAGIDLLDMGPALMGQEGETGRSMTEDDQVDPFNWGSIAGKVGRLRTTPMITAIHGQCLTAGIELAMSTDIVVAEEDATFSQGEVRRGLIPLGGAIERFTTRFGWNNAMRWLLTGDTFDAQEAVRMGLVQELTPKGEALARAMQIAERVAAVAPLGVKGTLANAFVAALDGPTAAAEHLRPFVLDNLSESKDLQEGIASMFERRPPKFVGA